MIILKKYFPIFAFSLVTILLIGTTVFYAPSWGLMDAAQLVKASHTWASNNVIENISNSINHNVYFMPFL